MSIVCGVDFSPLSLEAVTAAAALAGRAREPLWLVSILDPEAVRELGPNGRAKLEEGVMQRLEAEAARVRALAPSCEVAVGYGAAHAELKRFAEDKAASLLVVASAGHSKKPLISLSGTSERTALGAAPVVLVIRDAVPFEAWATRQRPLRVVVGADDGQATDAAVRWVNSLRAFGPVDLVIAHVYYADEAHLRYGLLRSLSYTERNPELEALIERDLKSRFPQVPGSGETFHRARLGLGRLADHLIELANEERADLLVVGTHGKRGVFRLGSVSSGTVHHATMAVAMVPASLHPAPEAQPAPGVRRVLVATDFSELGNAALPWALALAPPGAEVVLAHVTQTNGPAGTLLELYLPGTTIGDQPPARVVEEIERRLQALAQRSPESSHRALRFTVPHGPDVAAALCEAAAREGADLIVIGSHGRSALGRAALGSVADAVVRHAGRPVVIVPARKP
jgi:nucleotide-binding universal stress UspA family protein